MDTFFGIGGWEFLVILLIAGIVMGPKRIREVAHWLGKTTAQLQTMSRAFMQQLNAELDAVDSGEMRAAMEDVQELRRQVQELRQELTGVTGDTVKSGQEAIRESRELVENSIAPLSDQTAKPASSMSNGSSNALPKPVDVPDDPE
ncbi:MAG: twin-arginine translocase TatA/TatE family subunit [Chloroflexota bacterium]